MAPREKEFGVDLSDEVVRGSIVARDGEILPPAPRPTPPPAPARPAAAKVVPEPVAITPWQKKSREVAAVTAGLGGVLALGKFTGPLFMSNAFTFTLASLIGYRVVWGVVPALHSPLMSVTNAISGMVGVGGLFVLGGGYLPETIPQLFGAVSVLLAFVNVGGGFVITKRMLDMFKRECQAEALAIFQHADSSQGRLIPPNSRGCTASPPFFLAAGLSQPPQLALRAWFRQGISPAPSSASGPCLVWRRRPRRGWATCWACLALAPACWRACWLPASLPRFLLSLVASQPSEQWQVWHRRERGIRHWALTSPRTPDRQAHHANRSAADRRRLALGRRSGRGPDEHRQRHGAHLGRVDIAHGHGLPRCRSR